mmetsp:Transcript_73353/g.184928  ORF Transcript_73353/g.184928 Transcript_73353/m.184928 type:complete len:231 (+) Transcript_73353:466-1158(+)
MIVAAPDPELAAARHGSGEVVAGSDLHDDRRLVWREDGVVGLVEVVDLLELQLVARVPTAEPPEVALACGVDAALLRQHDRVLRAARHLRHLLVALGAEALHLQRHLGRVLVAVAQGTRAVPEAPAPAPSPQIAACCDRCRMVGAQRDLCDLADVRGPEADFCRVRGRASSSELASQLVVLVRAIREELAINHEGRVQRAARREPHAAHVFDQRRLLGDLGVLLLAHDAC